MFSMNTVSLQRFSRLFIAATLLSIMSVALTFTQAFGHVGDENPAIEVVPGSTSTEVEPGGTASESLTITNSGQDPLNYTVSVATSGSCSDMSAAEQPWLVVSGGSQGTVAPGESAQVDFSMVGTTAGEYNGILCVMSNDPENSVVEVPVSMVVTGDAPVDPDPEEPGNPGDHWDAVKEWIREMIERLKELLARLG